MGKYTDAKPSWISINQDNESIFLIVADDGLAAETGLTIEVIVESPIQ